MEGIMHTILVLDNDKGIRLLLSEELELQRPRDGQACEGTALSAYKQLGFVFDPKSCLSGSRPSRPGKRA